MQGLDEEWLEEALSNLVNVFAVATSVPHFTEKKEEEN